MMYPDDYVYRGRGDGFYPDEGGGGPWPGVGPTGGAPILPDPAPAAPPAAGGGGNGGIGGGAAGYSASLRPVFHFDRAPEFHAPQFHAPTFEEAQQTPGYQFRLDGGRQALERSAAAKGVLRTGGTLKDTEEYGQNFASQEYGNVYERALQAHDRDYRGAHDEFLPRFDEWRFLSAAEQTAAMAAYARSAMRGGGGGGGGNIAQDIAAAPPEPGAPPFLFKPGNTDPDLAQWLREHPNPGGGHWPGRDY